MDFAPGGRRSLWRDVAGQGGLQDLPQPEHGSCQAGPSFNLKLTGGFRRRTSPTGTSARRLGPRVATRIATRVRVELATQAGRIFRVAGPGPGTTVLSSMVSAPELRCLLVICATFTKVPSQSCWLGQHCACPRWLVAVRCVPVGRTSARLGVKLKFSFSWVNERSQRDLATLVPSSWQWRRYVADPGHWDWPAH